ncbi:MAG: SAM-dependent methyltransferase [Marinilabiliales bacterium]|nr:MAG: SAM-dependent methyltransferase [Marinilabiliales bacterium]
MKDFDRKKHWENIYNTKQINEVSWFQAKPETSLFFFNQLNIPTHAKVIDVGGGDSYLVDYLIDLGYRDITVLDISEAALNRAKKRLGSSASKVKWIVADVATYKPLEKYDCWHDRAAFHFLTQEKEITSYTETIQQYINPSGSLILGTFSDQGPKKCSGIEIMQYSETTMADKLKMYFEKINCITVDHETPSGSSQNFIFCSFRRVKNLDTNRKGV